MTRQYALFKLWKAERLKIAVMAGLNPLYDTTSDRALDSDSNSVQSGNVTPKCSAPIDPPGKEWDTPTGGNDVHESEKGKCWEQSYAM